MTRGGFGSNQIVSAASEIISQLSDNLQQHSKRMERKLEKPTDDNPHFRKLILNENRRNVESTFCSGINLHSQFS